jgi:hypothetical protein
MLNNLIEDLTDELTDEPNITTRWEACAAFSAADAGSSVCADCGWLDHEHGTDAVVHRLQAPVRPRQPKRLAS